MNIMISGSNGLIGSNLKNALTQQGHNIIALSRDFSKPIDFSDVDVVIHLAGENIAQKRWSEDQKDKIKNSRLIGTKQLSDQLAASEHKPSLFISSSATGYYGDRKDDDLNENSNHITKIELINNRLIPNPMECRSTVGQYNSESDTYNLYCSSQGVHSLKRKLKLKGKLVP